MSLHLHHEAALRWPAIISAMNSYPSPRLVSERLRVCLVIWRLVEHHTFRTYGAAAQKVDPEMRHRWLASVMRFTCPPVLHPTLLSRDHPLFPPQKQVAGMYSLTPPRTRMEISGTHRASGGSPREPGNRIVLPCRTENTHLFLYMRTPHVWKMRCKTAQDNRTKIEILAILI